jgi:hypothetical protein
MHCRLVVCIHHCFHRFGDWIRLCCRWPRSRMPVPLRRAFRNCLRGSRKVARISVCMRCFFVREFNGYLWAAFVGKKGRKACVCLRARAVWVGGQMMSIVVCTISWSTTHHRARVSVLCDVPMLGAGLQLANQELASQPSSHTRIYMLVCCTLLCLAWLCSFNFLFCTFRPHL